MKTFLMVIIVAVALTGCGSSASTGKTESNESNLSGYWSGDFSTYTADVTISTTDNINYTGHIDIRQKPLWPGSPTTPEWFSADIQGMFNLPATTTNVSSTYVLNGGNASITIIKDNATNAKIACGVSLYYGSSSFLTDFNNPDWLTKQ